MKNSFLSAYSRRIDDILLEMQSVSMMQIPTGNVKMSEVSNILRGARNEILRLQKEVDEVKGYNDELVKENKRLKNLFNTE